MTDRIAKEALNQAEKMRLIRKGALLGRPEIGPLEVGLILTYACNYDCIFCALPHEEGGIKKPMPVDTAKEIINDLAKAGTRQVSITGGGDPLCYNRIDSLVELICQLDMDCSVCTNGALLDDDRVERWAKLGIHLAVSFNAADEKTYQTIHSSAPEDNFKKILRQLKSFSAMAADHGGFASMNFVVCKPNSSQIAQMAELARSVGASQVQFRSIQPRPVHNHLVLDDSTLAEVRDEIIKVQNRYDTVPDFTIQASPMLQIQSKEPVFSCLEGYVASYIDSDGIVFPCCLRSVDIENHYMGNVFEQSFGQIWKEDSYNQFRRESRCLDLSKSIAGQNSCRHCPKARHFAYLIDEKAPGNYIPLYQRALSETENELMQKRKGHLGPLPERACNLRFESVKVQSEASPGDNFIAKVTVSNQSGFVWPGIDEAAKMPVGLGYHLLDSKGRMVEFDNNPRPYLPKSLGQSEEASFVIQIKAPEKPGKYFLEFDLLQETIFWFSQNGGATHKHKIVIM